MFAINLCLISATILFFAALYLIATWESETDFPCLRDDKDDKYYQQKRQGLKK